MDTLILITTVYLSIFILRYLVFSFSSFGLISLLPSSISITWKNGIMDTDNFALIGDYCYSFYQAHIINIKSWDFYRLKKLKVGVFMPSK